MIEIYQQPTGPTDAVRMQHDVDYTVCGNLPKSEQLKCKHTADKKNGKIPGCNSLEEKTMGTCSC